MEQNKRNELINAGFICLLIFFVTVITISLINQLNRIKEPGFWLSLITLLLFVWILSRELPRLLKEVT